MQLTSFVNGLEEKYWSKLNKVVNAICSKASSVKNAWCDVMITFGLETRRERTSSLTIVRDLSSKKSFSSSS